MNLFILIASSITSDSEKGDDLFFGDHHFFGQHYMISDVIDHYFMVAFTQFWLKTCMNIKYLKHNLRHTGKSSTAHSLENTKLAIYMVNLASAYE